MNQRNGKIEFFRFAFSIIVVLFHLNYTYFNNHYHVTNEITFFSHGCIGVEFFFLVTGWLFAKSCYKKQKMPCILGKDTIQFVGHKWFSVFPFHLIAFIATFISYIFLKKLSLTEIIVHFFQSIPNLFLVQKIGIYANNIIGEEWYISVMILSLAVLYPICRKYYEIFTRVISPLAGIFLVGYLYQKYGCLSNTSVWDGFFQKIQIRAFAEICLGVFAFECSRFISRLHFSTVQKWILSILEYGCYIAVILFTCASVSAKYEVYALYALMIAVILSFSEVTYGLSLFQNRVIFFLGKLSLPLYLSQAFARSIVQRYGSNLHISLQFAIIVLLNVLFALLVYELGKKVKEFMIHYCSKLTVSD